MLLNVNNSPKFLCGKMFIVNKCGIFFLRFYCSIDTILTNQKNIDCLRKRRLETARNSPSEIDKKQLWKID